MTVGTSTRRTAGADGVGRLARIALVAAALIALVAIAVAVRRSAAGKPAAAPSAATVAPQAPSDEITGVIGQLEDHLRTSPNDAKGWRMLGWSYYQTKRYPDAIKAYRRATTLEPGNAEGWSALGEAIAFAGNGNMPPEAEAAFRKALAIDAGDPRARYFLGVRKDLAGDHKGAVDDWIALLKDTPPGAPWERNVRETIAQVAAKNGIDVSGRVPAPASPAADAGSAAPTPEQMSAASAMTPKQQQAMVRGMVDRLATRLKDNPRDGEGWIRLMQARMVLGDRDAAAAAYRNATAAFPGDRAEQAHIADAARQFGVPGI